MFLEPSPAAGFLTAAAITSPGPFPEMPDHAPVKRRDPGQRCVWLRMDRFVLGHNTQSVSCMVGSRSSEAIMVSILGELTYMNGTWAHLERI